MSLDGRITRGRDCVASIQPARKASRRRQEGRTLAATTERTVDHVGQYAAQLDPQGDPDKDTPGSSCERTDSSRRQNVLGMLYRGADTRSSTRDGGTTMPRAHHTRRNDAEWEYQGVPC